MLSLFLFFCFPFTTIADDQFDLALVSLASESRVSVYELDKAKGSIHEIGDFKVDGDPGSQCFDAKRGVLYLGLRNKGEIVVLKLDRQAKKLMQLDTIKVDRDPAYLRVDQSGKWLFAAYYATGRISCMALTADGRIDHRADGGFEPGKSQWLKTAPRAHAILEDASNRFVFVPHTGPNQIFQFQFDASQGILSANKTPILNFPESTGPRHMVRHPKKESIWFSVNEQGSSVTALSMDHRGQLKIGKTISTIPSSFEGTNACADLEISQDGRFLYAANRGHDSLALFHVATDGGLKRQGVFPTEKTPRQFSLSPGGGYLAAAGQNSDKLALFRIDPDNGQLTRIQTVKTGKTPWWITCVD